jgi:hypothetical protein
LFVGQRAARCPGEGRHGGLRHTPSDHAANDSVLGDSQKDRIDETA